MKVRKFRFKIGDNVIWRTDSVADPTVYRIESRRFVYEEGLYAKEIREEYYLEGGWNVTSRFWSDAKYLEQRK